MTYAYLLTSKKGKILKRSIFSGGGSQGHVLWQKTTCHIGKGLWGFWDLGVGKE